MKPLNGLRRAFVDSDTSLGAKSRARRWQWMLDTFPDLAEMSVIDLGGRLGTWRDVPLRPAHVHVVNLEQPDGDMPDWAEFDHANVCVLPDAIAGRSYDLVFSNSVIEHVGGYANRVQFAEAVAKLADCHWVQTPYRYFPMEPHVLFPGFQFLPLPARATVAQHWPLSHTPPADKDSAVRAALETELLSRTEMRLLFPDSEIRTERVAGAPKSLIAVKRG